MNTFLLETKALPESQGILVETDYTYRNPVEAQVLKSIA
jgi:hypothetical protein